MDEGKVSVVIPVHNRAAFLREAVASVAAQTYRSIELLIVDDGSTDETGNVADQLSHECGNWVQVIHQKAAGAGQAREAGRVRATGEFIQYLDSDDRVLPEKFALQVEALKKNPDVDIAYGITRLIDADGGVLKEPYKWTGQRTDYLFPALLVDRWWCTHTPLYRRSLCDRIGPWSTLRYSQDWEYDARAGALRARLVYVDAVVSEHRQHGGGRQTGHGQWLSFPDQVVFFEKLYAAAVEAGVPLTSSEMKHFARWVFAASRGAGLSNDLVSAEQLLALTLKARRRVDTQVYQWMSTIIGHHRSARCMEGVRRLLGRRAGSETQRLAWMNEQ